MKDRILHKVGLVWSAAQEAHLQCGVFKNGIEFTGISILGRLRHRTVDLDFSLFTLLYFSRVY